MDYVDVTTQEKSHQRTCKLIEPIEAACIIKYEELKDKCLQPGFFFAKQYPKSLGELQSKHDNKIVSLSNFIAVLLKYF